MSEKPPSAASASRRIKTTTAADMIRTRNVQLICAFPAILTLFGVVLILIAVGSRTAGVPSWYRTMADDSFDARDFRTAAVCYQRLLQARPDDQAIMFDLAQSLQATGQPDGAASLLARLAPPDRVGYSPAQLTVARRLLDQKPSGALEWDAAEAHLSQVLRVESGNAVAKQMMAEISARRGK
jgi:predicted Zn-dependent protease